MGTTIVGTIMGASATMGTGARGDHVLTLSLTTTEVATNVTSLVSTLVLLSKDRRNRCGLLILRGAAQWRVTRGNDIHLSAGLNLSSNAAGAVEK